MGETLFRHFGVYLHNALFFNWSYLAADSERPQVSFPEECLVGRFARPVIYYVAGWILHGMKQAKGVAQTEKQMFFDFVAHNCLNAESAKMAGLPTSLVERRKKKKGAIMYCTQQFYDFVSFIESIYLNNLNLEMMMAHASGDLIHEIKEKILVSDAVTSKFSLFCDLGEVAVDGKTAKRLIEYIAIKYANMRGTFFVKHMNATGNRDVSNLVDSQATRTRVVNAVACSKAVGEVKKMNDDEMEKKVWEDAAESVDMEIENDLI